ncbi:MAG: SpoVA/SpoVAEb family sporulation membrane protein [Ruminococcaceae bacterium]|nr:SpoVA/SpoVAEb family sporulation membrane protein [Oscillospiraceae bacterium]
MNIDKSSYQKFAEGRAKRSKLLPDCAKAFVVGGSICTFGQGLLDLYRFWGASEAHAKMLVSVTIVFIAVLLTSFGIFDNIARFAGAGTLVPISGFANAVVSPALDTKAEGWVLGVGAKIFTIAGPVLLYGTLASVLYGVYYYLVGLFG